MKRMLVGIMVAALVAGSAGAEWRVYKVSETKKQSVASYEYTTNSVYGTNASGIGDAQTNAVWWNGASVTNPPYSVGVRNADGSPKVNFAEKTVKTLWSQLYIVNVDAAGKLMVCSNTVVTRPARSVYYQNGTLSTNFPARSETNYGTHTIGRVDYWTAKKCATFVVGTNTPSSEVSKAIKVVDMPYVTGNMDAVVTANGYQSLPGEALAAKTGSGFPRNFKRNTKTSDFYTARDQRNTTNDVWTSTDIADGMVFSVVNKGRYDEKLSAAVAAATDMTSAINLALAALVGQGYQAVDTYVQQDDMLFCHHGYDLAIMDNVQWVDFVAMGRNGTLGLAVFEKYYSLVAGFIVDQGADSEDEWWNSWW
jgi:hypothetical protein